MAPNAPRLSHQTLKLLSLFLDAPKLKLFGSEILKSTGMLSGTVYPILARLEFAGWLESDWERLDPREAGRPRRRFYKLTPTGYNAARAAFIEIGVPNGRLSWKR
jgi:PadR family transcriptional regulator PadR